MWTRQVGNAELVARKRKALTKFVDLRIVV